LTGWILVIGLGVGWTVYFMVSVLLYPPRRSWAGHMIEDLWTVLLLLGLLSALVRPKPLFNTVVFALLMWLGFAVVRFAVAAAQPGEPAFDSLLVGFQLVSLPVVVILVANTILRMVFRIGFPRRDGAGAA